MLRNCFFVFHVRTFELNWHSILCRISFCLLSPPPHQIGESEANLLADHGCTALVEGANMPTSSAANKVFKKRGVSFAPYKATIAVGTVASGAALAHTPLPTAEALDKALAARADDVFILCKDTAKEFNSRGDLAAGAQIAAFLRVAEVMERHGAV